MRCSCRCKKSQFRCVLDTGHKGHHKYTPKHLLSPSTISKILLELTSGEIKSLSGLDNIDVIKGHDNFENMRLMVDNLVGIMGSGKAAKRGEELKKQIDEVEIFHKVDFSRHLGIGASICTCLHCGFHDIEIDPIQCCINHKPPCKDCQSSFDVS